MSERVPIEILERHREYYNKQEGRKYPCSNQIVRCGIFTRDRDKAIEFMKDKIDRDIDRNIYECIVMPYTGFYCCSFEII